MLSGVCINSCLMKLHMTDYFTVKSVSFMAVVIHTCFTSCYNC